MKPINVVAITVLAAAALSSHPAVAVTKDRTNWDQGGPNCQLSVPTISSMVRPRATGMRNEGTTNEFIICQFAATSSAYNYVNVYVSAIDGVNHTVKCTGVAGAADGPTYSTKQVDTGTAGYTAIHWLPADFGETTTIGNPIFSVTCTLAAGSSIIATEAGYTEDVGA